MLQLEIVHLLIKERAILSRCSACTITTESHSLHVLEEHGNGHGDQVLDSKRRRDRQISE